MTNKELNALKIELDTLHFGGRLRSINARFATRYKENILSTFNGNCRLIRINHILIEDPPDLRRRLLHEMIRADLWLQYESQH